MNNRIRTLHLVILWFGFPLLMVAEPISGIPFSADSADVKTLDGIIDALYDVISGEAGPRDWDRLKWICKPGTEFSALGKGRDGQEQFFAGTLDRYIEKNGPFLEKNGFFEEELGRKVHQYRNLAQVFSTFGYRLTKNGPFEARGVNSIQVIYESHRWWIVSVLWNNETAEEPLPEELLKFE